jgi:hypothetical protein
VSIVLKPINSKEIMKYLVVKDPEDVYGGGIKPVEIHDDEKSAEIAVKLYTEQEKQTRDPRYKGFRYRIEKVPSVKEEPTGLTGHYLVVEMFQDSFAYDMKPLEVHNDEEGANRSKEMYEAKLHLYPSVEGYDVIFVKRGHT